jgi:peptidoglycan/LPS O-acetylase OafA/YrhL
MLSAYPVAAICIGALVTFFLATGVGNVLAKAGFPLPTSGRRIGCVDNLRGYLALSTMVHHFVIWLQIVKLGGTWEAPSDNLLNSLGKGSVAIFFMVTGLVFYPRILAGLRRTSWAGTYVGRVFRLVPLALLSVVVITLLIAATLGGRLGSTDWSALAQWVSGWDEPPLLGHPDSGRMNAFVLWSIWYEWLFYLFVLPLCALAMDLVRGRLPTWTVPLALFVVSGALRPLYLLGGSLTYLPLFALGMLAYEVQARPGLSGAMRSPALGVVSLAGVVVAMCIAPTPNGVVPLFLYFIFFVAVACGNDLAGLLRTPGAIVLGECSYGIYLLHGIVLYLMFSQGLVVVDRLDVFWLPVLLPVAGLVVACVTPVTYLLLERPGIRAGAAIAKILSRQKMVRRLSRQVLALPRRAS